MDTRQTLHVVVTRDRGRWSASLPGPPGEKAIATALGPLDRAVRTRALLVAGPDEVMLDYEFRTGDEELDRLVAEARSARRAAQQERRRGQWLVDQVLAVADAHGLSGRDLAVLLGISHQRVAQIVGRRGG